MDLLSWIVEDSFSTKLTFALLHFLWQGCCAGVVVFIGGLLLRNASARIRYSLYVVVMLAMAACLPITFFLVNSPNSAADELQFPLAGREIEDSQIPLNSLALRAGSDADQTSTRPIVKLRPNESIRASTRPQPEAPSTAGDVSQTIWLSSIASTAQSVFPVFSRWIAALYFCGVAMILGRLMRGIQGGRQLRKMATVITESALLESVRKLAHQVGLKAAPTVAWCEQISVPVVVGVLRPMILLPTAIVSGLTPGQLQALLLHELSHIRRLDPIVNLFQRIIEAILFFHPVVWFVSRRISWERENAADDMVLDAGWDRPLYADALVRVAELASALSKPDDELRTTVLCSSGTTPSEFKLRILRLLGSRPPKLDVSRAGFTMALALLFLAGSGLLAWSQAGAQEESSAGAPTGQSVRGEHRSDELEPFQGTWAMDLCDSETRDLGRSQAVVKTWRWAINGKDILWSRSGDEVWKLTFAVNPNKSPKEIDLTFLDGPHKGEKCLGMYEWGGVDGKMLLMSVQDPGAKVERPKSISMKSGEQTSLIFLEPMNVERELASLQGTWKFEIIQTDGWPKPVGKGPDRLGRGDDRRWVIKGNEITWTSPDGEEVKLAFTIDPTKSPRHFDVTFLSGPHKGQKCLGMYERGGLGGAVLWLCLTDPGSPVPRPTNVSYSFQEGRTMIGLIRFDGPEKPADKAQSDVQTLRKPALLLPDHWIMQAVEFDSACGELVTASYQSFITIRRWDLASKKLLSEIKLQADEHGRAFREGTLKFSGDRQRVVAATDAYVGIWETATGKLLKQLPFNSKEGIYDCAIDKLDCTPDFSVIVGHRALPGRLTRSYDAHVMVWDGVSGSVLKTVIDQGATDLKAIDLSTDGKRLVTTNGSGAKIWETSTGQLLRSIPNDNTSREHSEPDVSSQYTSHVWSVQFSPDGKQLAMGDILGVKLLDATSGKLLQQLEGPYRYSSSGSPGLVFSKDGQWLARLGTQEKAEGDKHLYVVPIWSTRTGARLFELHTEANAAAFSDDGQRLAAAFSDMQQALSIWTLSGDAANVEQTAGPGPHSRQDRVEENGHYVGKTASESIDKFKPIWGDTQLGLQYGIALTKPQPQRKFRRGERVPLVVFFRNASDKPIKFDTAPDFFGNTPRILNSRGELITLENVPLLGSIPHYFETLGLDESLGPFYLSFGLGENPRPGQQHWHPYCKSPNVGTFKLTHSASINVSDKKDDGPKNRTVITTGQIEFEIAD